MTSTKNDHNQVKEQGTGKKVGRNIMRVVISLLLIAAGIAGARFLITTKPRVNKKPPVKMEPLVRTAVLQPANYTVTIPAMGTVTPSREISLKTQVSGEVVSMHPQFIEGGILAADTRILQLDPQEYELAVKQKQKALAEAEYSYRLEQGYQDVARQEWDLLYGDRELEEAESDLALRKPHLEKVKVDISSAGAELEKAKLDLARTTITAPFNGLVLERYVDLGSQVSAQEKLADLVGTDEYWIEVPIPVERLQWIRIPNGGGEPGSKATILYRGDNVREGRVSRLLPDLTKEGRMARLLVEVQDPLDLRKQERKRPMLLLGEYVRVEITGEELQDVYRIPRSALHNDSEVWIMDDDNSLEIRPVQTTWRDEESVIVRHGFTPGERLVISDLAAPVAGMKVRADNPDNSTPDSRQMPEDNR